MTARARPPVVAGWQVLAHLGSGGMGDVWKARRQDGVVAALKVVRPMAGVAPAEVASHFRREASACLHLDHPNLVRALDAGLTADGAAYLALEFVEGRTLLAALAAEGALDEPRVLEIGIALARALAEVHRLGLVHRDVTPRNVMLTSDGAAGGVKLLDLGLVVEAQEDQGERTMGTAGFVAPEVAAGGRADARADLYALGAILASAASGELPTGAPLPGRSDAARAAPRKRMSPGLRQVVQRLLQEDPAARYATAAEVVLDLEALAAGERPLGAILGAGGARVARRGPWIAAGVAVVLAGGAAIWAFGGREDEPGDAAARDPVAPADTSSVPPVAPRNPALEAAALFVGRFPDDFARGRALLDEADAGSLTADERRDLARLRSDFDARFTAAADREHADRAARLAAAAEAGDVPAVRRIASEWPAALHGSPREAELAQAAAAAAAAVSRANEALAAEVDAFAGPLLRPPSEVTTAADPASEAGLDASLADLGRRIDLALARPLFDGDGREALLARRDRLGEARTHVLRARIADQSVRLWREFLADHLRAPTPSRLREALAAGSEDAVPAATRETARAVAAALDRADTWTASRLALLRGKTWCRPHGAALVCSAVAETPTAEELFVGPLWAASGGRGAAAARVANGTEEGAAWLLARGLVEDARAASGPDGAVTRLLADVPPVAPAAAEQPAWPAGVDVALALRAVGARDAKPATKDAVVAAWSAAAGAAATTSPGVSASSKRNPAKAAGRDAFLDGTLDAAARSLTEAAVADPLDPEVAALRGRTWLAAARVTPTAPALLAAFSEGRRAWDLDPKLAAGPVLAAEAGMDLVGLAGADVAERALPVVVAACEAAESLGRADARMLLFAGEHHLDAGRASQAAPLLRRAAALAPNSGRAAFLLARAEHAAGRPEKAREALRRARDLLGDDLPASASALARALGM